MQNSGAETDAPRRRREAILNVYNLALCALLFASPWLFGFAREVARVDAWMSGAVIIAISIAALVRFAEWEEWVILAVALWRCGCWRRRGCSGSNTRLR